VARLKIAKFLGFGVFTEALYEIEFVFGFLSGMDFWKKSGMYQA